jgi:exportin-7
MTLQEHLKQNIELFPRLLQQFFQLIIYEECGNQWSVSRTMLSLIAINPPMFEEIKKRVIFKVGQNDEQRRLKMIEAFDKLMEGVEMNLEAKTRDKFTGNLITFRQDVRAIL